MASMKSLTESLLLGSTSCLIALSATCWDVAQAQRSTPVGHTGQISPMRPDSLKVTPITDLPRQAPEALAAPASLPQPGVPQLESDGAVGQGGGFTYDPAGRRDPFAPILQPGAESGKPDASLPPLQQVGLSELNLIGIVWGAYGYTALIQTPDGKGYTVRRGTRIGMNNGVVSAVTERGIIVQERFTDIYGKKQEREHVKLLHAKEGSE